MARCVVLVETLATPFHGSDAERSPRLNLSRFALSSSVPSNGLLSYLLIFSPYPLQPSLFEGPCLDLHLLAEPGSVSARLDSDKLRDVAERHPADDVQVVQHGPHLLHLFSVQVLDAQTPGPQESQHDLFGIGRSDSPGSDQPWDIADQAIEQAPTKASDAESNESLKADGPGGDLVAESQDLWPSRLAIGHLGGRFRSDKERGQLRSEFRQPDPAEVADSFRSFPRAVSIHHKAQGEIREKGLPGSAYLKATW